VTIWPTIPRIAAEYILLIAKTHASLKYCKVHHITKLRLFQYQYCIFRQYIVFCAAVQRKTLLYAPARAKKLSFALYIRGKGWYIVFV
jgi:hypothetical protein